MLTARIDLPPGAAIVFVDDILKACMIKKSEIERDMRVGWIFDKNYNNELKYI